MFRRVDVYAIALALLSPAAALAQSNSNYANTVLSHNPVAYWRLNETTLGPAVDASAVGGLQNGTYVNFGTGVDAGNIGQAGPRPTTLVLGQPLLGFEANNVAPNFAGAVSTHVAVPDSAALSITGAFSLEAWVNPTTLGTGNNGIVAKYMGAGNDRSYQMFVNSQSGIGALGSSVSQDGTFIAGVSNQVVGPTALATNTWQHVVATFVPDKWLRVYVNGVEVASLTEPPTNIISSIDDNISPLWIGATFDLGTAASFFGGLIDEVAVYNYALDDINGDGVVDANNRVAQHFNAAFVAVPAVPEPHSIVLWAGLACGLFGAAVYRRRRRASA